MQATILKLMTEILALMSLMVSQVQAPVAPVVSSEPYLPKTSYVVPFDRLGAYNPTAGGTYRTQSSIGLSDVTITLSSFKEPISNLKYTMSYLNSSIEYGTIEPSNQTNKEFVSFTGITQNADGTATLTGVSRGLGFSYPYTASTTLVRTHSGQSVFILSNPPQLTNQYANKSNTETITGAWTFSTSPTVPTPVASTDAVTKGYVDGGILAGAATSTESVTGIVRLATALQGASSTPTTANTPYVLQAQNATSTYNSATAPLKVVVTQNNGKIDPNFTDYTANRTWVGTNLFQASTTMVATTTIGASNVTNNALRLNGVPYAFPSAQGVASTTLQNDGNGNLSWLGYSKLLTTRPSTGFTCLSNDAASTTAYSIIVPANTMGVKNVLRLRTTITGQNFATSDVLAFELGFGTASTTHIVTVPATNGLPGGGIDINIAGNGATNSQIANITISESVASGASKGASFSQDSTTEKKVTLITRRVSGSGGPLTCGTTIAEIIQ